MAVYIDMSKTELKQIKSELMKEYEGYKSQNLKLDMSRGKPGSEQLDISMKILDTVTSETDYHAENGFDCRNYGILDGIPEMKKIFADFFEASVDEVIVAGNSSLNLMYDYISQAMTHGTGAEPWCKQGEIKFICPVPGYDRHFAILEHFGIKMINVEMLETSPDMQHIEELVKDETVKGMICVPKYTNPEGKTYDDECVRRIAKLKPAAKDFKIIWDNAYSVHHLSNKEDNLLNILQECKKNGNEDMVVMFGSTSKITFPGSGVAALAASKNTISQIKKRFTVQTIGYDKINQLRHVRFFKDMNGIVEHMKLHASLISPKFDVVLKSLEEELGDLNIAQWVKPNGGYFISLNVMPGCAKRVVQLCKEAGVVLTGAGATFPYGKDPLDRNIRIAPTYPPVEELKIAVKLLCLTTKIASLEKLIAE